MLKVKDIKPVFTRIVTTANRYEENNTTNSGVLIDAKKLEGAYKEYQTVVRVGSAVREVKEGDVILIDPTRYIKRRYSENSLRNDIVENPVTEVNIPTVTMNDEDYFLIDQSDIIYIITDSEEVETPKPSSLIMPKDTKILL